MAHEEWRDVVGYEGFYQVSNLGRVRSVDRNDSRGTFHPGKILAQKTGERGYKRVHMSKNGKAKWFSVHRLVAKAYCDGWSRDNDIVNHLDCNPSNNRADNLEWTTYSGNMQYASSLGHMKGCLENQRKAVEALKVPIVVIAPDGTRATYESGVAAAKAIGCSSGHIAACCRQEYGYKHVGNGYRTEYADPELQAAQRPNRVGMTPDELSEHRRNLMLGNKHNLGHVTSEETKAKLRKATGWPVAKLDRRTGEVLETFDSVSYAEKLTGIAHICDVVLNKRKTAGGFSWKYLKDL